MPILLSFVPMIHRKIILSESRMVFLFSFVLGKDYLPRTFWYPYVWVLNFYFV